MTDIKVGSSRLLLIEEPEWLPGPRSFVEDVAREARIRKVGSTEQERGTCDEHYNRGALRRVDVSKARLDVAVGPHR